MRPISCYQHNPQYHLHDVSLTSNQLGHRRDELSDYILAINPITKYPDVIKKIKVMVLESGSICDDPDVVADVSLDCSVPSEPA